MAAIQAGPDAATPDMEAKRMTRVQQVGDRIEELLGTLSADGRAGAAAEELVTLLVGLYGDGLARIVAALHDNGAAGSAVLDTLTEDPLVENLLLLHGLHPLDVDARIQRALDRVRPYLGSHAGGVHYIGVTDGVAHLQLEGNCDGCPSSTVTVQLAIEGAVQDAAPEVTGIVVEGVTAPPKPAVPTLLQIGPRPGAAPEPAAAEGDHGSWVTLENIGPPSSRPIATSAGGVPILVCSVRGTLYAYRDACAACGTGMAGGRLDREKLTCECGTAYDVTRAGRALSDPALHLDPLPLVTDSQGVRVAVPTAVRS
jgi:Fe-S cluster biogenesis protein NfuA/nitrite reductase/ring-hydroxylating ferredoxin subunit